jgi:hypothetical protein
VKWLRQPLAIFSLLGHRQVKFENYSKEAIDLPNAKLLEIHAAIAKVLHMSGAAECLDLVMDRFNPESFPVPSRKFGSSDLETRLFVLGLSGEQSCSRARLLSSSAI